ncbi:MAG: type II toxin-antitoxin system VapC family toxin [Planctomycetes bacterium]|nr:type II toxin-antitoxin system VapC family toxin [Planctomycetota bacterium]NBY02526.1 type II toxin-antitoxin system VapC family toxin [Planctomycetota bacterium]
MNILLDTHTFLWFWWDDPLLGSRAKNVIRDPANRKLVSLVSYWEVAIKLSQKKIDLGGPYKSFMTKNMLLNNFEILPISEDHLAELIDLPFHHKDPFDRMLVVQALHENIPIISKDLHFDAYGVARIW